MVKKIAWVLVIIGALNWGIVGLAHKDVIMMIFGSGTLTSLIYDLVGLSGLYLIFAR